MFWAHKCESCGKSYGQKGALKNHVKAVHENAKVFSCGSCDNNFEIGRASCRERVC